MALPGNITTITVTGSFTSPAGVPAAGTVVFTPSSPLFDTAGTTILTAAPITATLTSGSFTTTLPCTDNTSIRPAWYWLCTINVPYAAQQAVTFYLPSTLGATVDLSALVPIPSQPVATNGIYVSSVNGQSGALYLPAWTSSSLPAAAVAETVPRSLVSSGTTAMVSGTLYLAEITLAAGYPSVHWNWLTGTTGSTTTSHWWGVLLSSVFDVVAVTADQGTTPITGSAALPVPWTGAFTAPYTGIYYWGVMVAASAMPTSSGSGVTPASTVAAALPFAGPSTTGLTTPPGLRATLAAITSQTGPLYGYLT